MKVSYSHRILISSILVIILLSGCHPSPRELAVVTGKTVFGDLALEDVHIRIHRWEEAGWRYLSDSRSGYHGSFRVHLPPGEYKLTASKTIRMGEEEVLLSGSLDSLIVKNGERRKDRLVIEMSPGGDGTRGQVLVSGSCSDPTFYIPCPEQA